MSGSKKKVIKADQLENELSLEDRLNLKDKVYSEQSFQDAKIISSDKSRSKASADEIIQKAEEEADRIKKHAKKIYLEVEKRVDEASAKGYEDGREEGVQALTDLAIRMQKKNQEIVKSLEKQAVQLVYEIARKVIGDAFVSSEDVLLGMIRQALQSSMGEQLVILVNPEDYQKIQDKQSKLMSVLHGSQTLVLKPAETVKKNSCIIESEMGTLEANLENQLKAIGQALGVEDDNGNS